MKRVIVFNGPPRSGKDESANFLKKRHHNASRIVSFKEPLIKLTASFYGLTVEDFLIGYDLQLSNGDWHKDKLQRRLGLKSQRGALIHVSENVIKPVFGEASFGLAMAETIRDDDKHSLFIAPDSGFVAELEPLRDEFKVTVVRLDRLGCSFGGDSRSYLPDWDYAIANNGTLLELENAIHAMEDILC